MSHLTVQYVKTPAKIVTPGRDGHASNSRNGKQNRKTSPTGTKATAGRHHQQERKQQPEDITSRNESNEERQQHQGRSVADPVPPDPHVFGPPGSGSFYPQSKIVSKL
jgi:hypothetical protein